MTSRQPETNSDVLIELLGAPQWQRDEGEKNSNKKCPPTVQTD